MLTIGAQFNFELFRNAFNRGRDNKRLKHFIVLTLVEEFRIYCHIISFDRFITCLNDKINQHIDNTDNRYYITFFKVSTPTPFTHDFYFL